MKNLVGIYEDLTDMKTKELEECNKELNKRNHTAVINKALVSYKAELEECLEMYARYLNIK